MGDLNPFGGGSGSSNTSNAGSSLGSSVGDAFAGLQDTFSNLFGGGGGTSAALSGDASGMSGFDPTGLFGNIDNTAFNEDTSSIQATQAITPPAQAQANAATGQDPSAGIGGTQSSGGTQTASTGPGGQNQPSQEQQDEEQRNKGLDTLRRLLKQRQKQQQQPPQWNPRYAAAPVQAQPGIGRGAGAAAGLYSPNISPDAAVRAGLLAPDMIDPATGTIRRDQPPAEDPLGSSVEISPRPPPALPDPSGPTGAGQVVPRAGTDVLPPRTVPGTPGALTAPGTTPPTLPAPSGLGMIGGGLGAIASRALPFAAGPIGAIEQLLWNTTPAETGELPSKYWPKPEDAGPEDPEIRARQREGMSPGQRPPESPPTPPPRPKDQPKPKPKAHPAAAQPPRRVWVPPTPGRYVPTPGLGRGSPTWVPGTPGHYVESPAPGQGRPPAAARPGASVQGQNAAGAAQRFSEARAEAPPGAMAYNQNAQVIPTILRDIAGLGIMPRTLGALAGEGRRLPNVPSSAYGRGGTRPYNENWGGAAYVGTADEVQRGRQFMGYLTGKGLTRQGAAALLGNAHQESNLSATLDPGGDGGTAAGMFQWRGPRQAAFRRWLAANGRSEKDPQAHLDFALLEMQSNPAYRPSWDALHNPNMTPAQIADIIANNYEGSKRGPTQGMNNRIGFANDMLQGGATAASAPPPVPMLATGGDARG